MFDLIIIGCGSAGLEAAKEALKYTKKVLCIERAKEEIGGTCLNRGCVPTKFLREAAYLKEKVENATFYGLKATYGGFNFSEAVSSVRGNVIKPIREGSYKYLTAKGVKFLFTDGVELLDRNHLKAGGKIYKFRYLLLATGSSPSAVPNVVPDGKFILDTDSVWELEEVPKRVLIVGGGVSGVEFAHIFKSLGAGKVVIVELLPSLLGSVKNLSTDVVRRLERFLKKEGVEVKLRTVVEDIDPSKGAVKLSDGTLLEVDRVLLTVGRKPNTQIAGLQEVGVKLDPKGFIEFKKGYRTTVENIFAAGDILPTPALAHTAKWEAKLAVKNMFENLSEELDYLKVPSVVYSAYEVGSFGKGEKELKEEGITYQSYMLTFRPVAKALAEREDGLIKVFAAEDGTILGANVLSKKHTDSLLHLLLEAGNLNRLKEIVFAHPTVEEVLENFDL